jgi:hypothetical protein
MATNTELDDNELLFSTNGAQCVHPVLPPPMLRGSQASVLKFRIGSQKT